MAPTTRRVCELWRPVDWIGRQIQLRFTPLWQLRYGVLMMAGAIVMHVLGPISFASEPPAIYQASMLALTFTGVSFIATARLSAITEETEQDVDSHRGATE